MRGLTSAFLTFLAFPTFPRFLPFPDPSPPVMFRGTPEHTGYSDAAFFPGQVACVGKCTPAARCAHHLPSPVTGCSWGAATDSCMPSIARAGGSSGAIMLGGRVDASPAVAQRLIVGATIGGRIFAVSETSGKPRWSFTTGTCFRRIPRLPAGGISGLHRQRWWAHGCSSAAETASSTVSIS